MTDRLPTLKAKDLIRVLRKLGFYEARQKGSHLCLKHPDGRFTLVPCHGGEDVDRGLLRQILREIEIAPNEFLKILD
ncbi:type II toxin-antitoxin system HicA family toxin [Patescibacteria group bacterium]|nr:type II toxin-antitoxin system HicA family toxin [Patescibacteria group bacterium]